MDCDCNMPDCLVCFLRYVKDVEDAGYADKELYWEGIELESRLAVEEYAERNIPEEIYNLKDSW
jgi:uncharacterized protein with ATP-grasp and redox domains